MTIERLGVIGAMSDRITVISDAIAAAIRDYRKRQGMTREELAAELWEAGAAQSLDLRLRLRERAFRILDRLRGFLCGGGDLARPLTGGFGLGRGDFRRALSHLGWPRSRLEIAERPVDEPVHE